MFYTVEPGLYERPSVYNAPPLLFVPVRSFMFEIASLQKSLPFNGHLNLFSKWLSRKAKMYFVKELGYFTYAKECKSKQLG